MIVYRQLSRRGKRFFPLFSFLLGIAFLAFVVCIGTFVRALGGIPDWSALPPEEGFEHVFDIPPPAGIKNLKVAGYANLGGSTTYMRFEVDNVDRVLRVLKENPDCPLSGPHKKEESILPESDAYFQKFERVVAWESVHHIKRPEHYSNSGPRGTILVIIDRQRRLMFVYAYFI